MVRGTLLTEFERGQISILAEQNMSIRENSKKIKRSTHAIHRYLKNPAAYGKNHGGGKPRALSQRDERAIFRVASNSSFSVRKIKALAGVAASRWTVWRALRRNKNLKRVKLLTGPKLTEAHKIARLNWALALIEDRLDWSKVIFSDEKKFNLDGPDGFSFYWHDLRKAPRERMSRVLGGGGVMVWACMAYGGVRWTEVHGRLDANDYFSQVLEVHLVPYGEQLGGPNWIFQQDNASIHRAAADDNDFRRVIPRQLEWP